MASIFWLEHDNTDFPRNPSRGSRQVVNVHRDFGWFDSDDSWTSADLSLSKYFDLGTSGWFRQQVLALNYWTSINTDWDENADGTIDHNPPPGFGSELGGYDRLRGYASERFNDKAAVHYTAELRLIPGIQPLRDLPILNYFQIDWWQIVPFVEAGRVSDKYNSDLYFKDLKWDAGVGIRLMTFRAVVRLDFAVGEEGGSVYAMVSHPFSRMGK
jgi:outer membrane translocation and assembly module TamA